MSTVDYGFDRLELVTVKLTEMEYKHAIIEAARAKVLADGKVDAKNWGAWAELHEAFISPDETKKWAEVEFHRRVSEETPE